MPRCSPRLLDGCSCCLSEPFPLVLTSTVFCTPLYHCKHTHMAVNIMLPLLVAGEPSRRPSLPLPASQDLLRRLESGSVGPL